MANSWTLSRYTAAGNTVAAPLVVLVGADVVLRPVSGGIVVVVVVVVAGAVSAVVVVAADVVVDVGCVVPVVVVVVDGVDSASAGLVETTVVDGVDVVVVTGTVDGSEVSVCAALTSDDLGWTTVVAAALPVDVLGCCSVVDEVSDAMVLAPVEDFVDVDSGRSEAVSGVELATGGAGLLARST